LEIYKASSQEKHIGDALSTCIKQC